MSSGFPKLCVSSHTRELPRKELWKKGSKRRRTDEEILRTEAVSVQDWPQLESPEGEVCSPTWCFFGPLHQTLAASGPKRKRAPENCGQLHMAGQPCEPATNTRGTEPQVHQSIHHKWQCTLDRAATDFLSHFPIGEAKQLGIFIRNQPEEKWISFILQNCFVRAVLSDMTQADSD